MGPQPRVPLVATVQQAITTLLTTHEPEFLRLGYSLFLAFAHNHSVAQPHGQTYSRAKLTLGNQLPNFARLSKRYSFVPLA